MIAVMGATGNTGRVAVEALLKAGQKVRALGRSPEKLKALVDRGAEVLAGDAGDLTFLTRAFSGASAAYTLIPPDARATDFRAYQDRMGEVIAAAIRSSGLKHVVFLSSLGGDQPGGTGPIAGLHAQEERLRNIPGLSAVVLRPTFFFENHFSALGMIKHQGITGGAIKGDLPFPQVATRDIGEAAARILRDPTLSGFSVQELLGPRDISLNEVASLLGSHIGKPDLKYVQFPYDAFAAALTQAGLSADLGRLYAEMAGAFNEGRIKSVLGRNAGNTTPTTFESFVPILAQAYNAM
jgi:uncharacterized protein YbjT (DUF2867 family)